MLTVEDVVVAFPANAKYPLRLVYVEFFLFRNNKLMHNGASVKEQ